MKNYKKNRNNFLQEIQKKKSNSQIEILNFSIEIPDLNPLINSNNIVENGSNNSIFDFIEECYNESPTNASIINSIGNYIAGNGIVDKNGKDISKLISNEDIRLISLDVKKFGCFALQILWNLDEEISAVKYLNVKKVMMEIDDFGDTIAYHYSFDLKNKSKFPLTRYTKFNGTFKRAENEDEENSYREILVVQIPSSRDFWHGCDYIPALQYAQLEKSLAETAINFSNNQFQGSTLIDINSGIPPTDELKAQYTRNIINELTDTKNSGRIIVSFNEDAESAPVVTQLPLPEISDTFSLFSLEAQEKLVLCHAVPPTLFSFKSATNLGSSKDEILEATKSLFLRIINPYRNIILGGLNSIFKSIDESYDLEFVDPEILKNMFKNDEENGE